MIFYVNKTHFSVLLTVQRCGGGDEGETNNNTAISGTSKRLCFYLYFTNR